MAMNLYHPQITGSVHPSSKSSKPRRNGSYILPVDPAQRINAIISNFLQRCFNSREVYSAVAKGAEGRHFSLPSALKAHKCHVLQMHIGDTVAVLADYINRIDPASVVWAVSKRRDILRIGMSGKIINIALRNTQVP